MGSPRVQGVALLAGLLRAINKRCCQHPPLDPRLFSSSPPLFLYIYIRVCVCIYMYIYFSVFSLRVLFFFLTFFITLFFSPLILSRSFFPRTCFLSRKFIVSLFLSRCLEYSFQSTNSFPKSIVFFFSFLFFIRTVSRGLFSLYLRRSSLVFRLDRFHAFRVVSQIPPLRLSFLLYRIQGISLSIFPVDSSQNRLDFRSLPPRLSRIPPLATLSLSFVPPLGIFTSSLFVARYFITSFTFMQFMQLHTKLISFSIVKFLNSMMFFLDRFILLPHFHS